LSLIKKFCLGTSHQVNNIVREANHGVIPASLDVLAFTRLGKHLLEKCVECGSGCADGSYQIDACESQSDTN